ncbi:Hypothetical predicted protein [Marmota monax]|uniref:Uncharacterized protein n=1 Tax=Marmota monax TaxID=9995 RepID=A0A5E4D2F2_MARMO|nr:Hypothetical predicted protein [Marmota monax]
MAGSDDHKVCDSHSSSPLPHAPKEAGVRSEVEESLEEEAGLLLSHREATSQSYGGHQQEREGRCTCGAESRRNLELGAQASGLQRLRGKRGAAQTGALRADFLAPSSSSSSSSSSACFLSLTFPAAREPFRHREPWRSTALVGGGPPSQAQAPLPPNRNNWNTEGGKKKCFPSDVPQTNRVRDRQPRRSPQGPSHTLETTGSGLDTCASLGARPASSPSSAVLSGPFPSPQHPTRGDVLRCPFPPDRPQHRPQASSSPSAHTGEVRTASASVLGQSPAAHRPHVLPGLPTVSFPDPRGLCADQLHPGGWRRGSPVST